MIVDEEWTLPNFVLLVPCGDAARFARFFIHGFFLFFRNMFDLDFNDRYPPNYVDKIMGTVCLLYGSWRIYRGYKKNYFK